MQAGDTQAPFRLCLHYTTSRSGRRKIITDHVGTRTACPVLPWLFKAEMMPGLAYLFQSLAVIFSLCDVFLHLAQPAECNSRYRALQTILGRAELQAVLSLSSAATPLLILLTAVARSAITKPSRQLQLPVRSRVIFHEGNRETSFCIY